jgi:hypothetical protein
MRSRHRLAPLGLAALLFVPRVLADAKIDMVVATDSKESISPHEVFTPNTAKIYVVFTVTASKPARVKAIWTAEKVQGVPDNSKMTESSTNVQAGTFMSAFSYPKPATGWPPGTYRVDFEIDDKHEKTVKFKVAK